MVKETTGPGVHCCNGGNVIRAQFEVEHIEILYHSFFANRLGQDHDAALRQPAEYHLGNALLVLRCDCAQRWILEDVIPPLRKWRPRLRLNSIGLQELLGVMLLQERIDFDLIDCRDHPVVQQEIHDAVRMKVSDANRPDFAPHCTSLPWRATRHTRHQMVDE